MTIPTYISLPAGWMPESTRLLLRAVRPWSIPASLVPCVLSAALVYPRIAGLSQLLLPVTGAICLHMFGNLVNTYYDYHKGVDTKATADDRTLVDGTVSSRTVAVLAAVFLLLGGSSGLFVVLPVGAPLFVISAGGAALALFYTADPLNLKYLGLGDVTVFLAFGERSDVRISQLKRACIACFFVFDVNKQAPF
jgi:menadiol prenyltransferase